MWYKESYAKAKGTKDGKHQKEEKTIVYGSVWEVEPRATPRDIREKQTKGKNIKKRGPTRVRTGAIRSFQARWKLIKTEGPNH